MQDLRVAVDVGGTFTDVFIFDNASKETRVTKVPSTPEDPMRAVLDGVSRAGINLADVRLFSHGTTVATNALITRNFPKAAMVTTSGFRDVIEIRDGTKDNLWDAYSDVSGPYIRRRDRFEIVERTDYSGRVLEPVDDSEARKLAALLKKRGTKAVAVCFMNSYANMANELKMREILEDEIPDITVSTSAEILPEIFEYDRFNTTVANTVLGPLVADYVERLDKELTDGGYESGLLVLHSGGGSMTPALTKRYPARLAASGIAAGAIAAQHTAKQCGYDNAIGLDMGGTSTDISMVHEGELRRTNRWEVEYGHPIIFPSIEVLTIGAGGGSLAHVDIAGSLRNGPQSAGATPGPACYGQGGTEPTNTDANLVLCRLGESLADGAMTLKRDLAENAIQENIGKPLRLETAEAAQAMLDVANANIADAVRLVSVRRGLDIRDFALIAFGGAGALHGAAVAKDLGMQEVIVPPSPGVGSALGCLLVDIQHDLSAMYMAPAAEADTEDLEQQFQQLEAEAIERLRQEGVDEANSGLERGISMRYQGQWRSLQVSMESGRDFLAGAVKAFHEEHEKQFAFRQETLPVEIYQIHLRALGKVPKPEFSPTSVGQSEMPDAASERNVYFDGEKAPTPVYARDDLRPGMLLQGPVIVEALDSTVVVPQNSSAEIDEWFNIRIFLPKNGEAV